MDCGLFEVALRWVRGLLVMMGALARCSEDARAVLVGEAGGEEWWRSVERGEDWDDVGLIPAVRGTYMQRL